MLCIPTELILSLNVPSNVAKSFQIKEQEPFKGYQVAKNLLIIADILHLFVVKMV